MYIIRSYFSDYLFQRNSGRLWGDMKVWVQPLSTYQEISFCQSERYVSLNYQYVLWHGTLHVHDDIYHSNTVTSCFHERRWRCPGGGGMHSHQLPYGGVPLYRVDFERPVSLKYGVISSNFPKIGYDVKVWTASGARDYEIFLITACVFGVRTPSAARDYEIFPKIGYIFGGQAAFGAQDCEISRNRVCFRSPAFPKIG